MESIYWGLFTVLAVLVGGLLLTQRNEGSIVPASGKRWYRLSILNWTDVYLLLEDDSPTGANVSQFLRLRNNYIVVYGLMMGEPQSDEIARWPRCQGSNVIRLLRSRRLAPRALCLRPLLVLWVWREGHRSAVYRRIWIQHDLWHNRRKPCRQTVSTLEH